MILWFCLEGLFCGIQQWKEEKSAGMAGWCGICYFGCWKWLLTRVWSGGKGLCARDLEKWRLDERPTRESGWSCWSSQQWQMAAGNSFQIGFCWRQPKLEADWVGSLSLGWAHILVWFMWAVLLGCFCWGSVGDAILKRYYDI